MEKMRLKTNSIYCGDCIDILQHFPENYADLIYLDPPFSSGRIYNILFGTNYEKKAFDDRWKGGIHHYVEYMRERIELCKHILKDTGSIYYHCDWHASHYIKEMMDDIFGYNNFRNEIVWLRSTDTGSSKAISKKFPANSDSILLYTKSNDFVFNPQYKPYGEDYLKRFKYSDKKGRYRWQCLKTYSEERLKKLQKENRVRWGKRAKYPEYKQYKWELKGVLISNVWTDINQINPASRERLGYPTQKPEALLERIVKTSTNEGLIVLDPFCGCGTAIAVAHKLRRRWIGIDISPTACKVMKQRMGNVKTMGIYAVKNVHIINLPKTEKDLWKLKPFEFENWVCDVLFAYQTKKAKDMGIDGYTLDGTPIQAKQIKKVGRPLVDNFETAIKRAKKNKGIIVAFGFTKDAHEEVARIKKEGIEITLRTIKELLEMGF